MEAMRESWTDQRLDNFREDVGRRFDLLEEIVTAGFAQIDIRLGRLEDSFASLNRTLVHMSFGLGLALLSVIIAMFGIIVTQL